MGRINQFSSYYQPKWALRMQRLHCRSFILVPEGTVFRKIEMRFETIRHFFLKIGQKLKYNLEEIKEGRMDELGWPPLFSFSTECILFWFQVFICGAHIPPWASGWPPEFQLFVFARIIQV